MKRGVWIILLLFSCLTIVAQNGQMSEAESKLEQKAIELFNQEKWQEASPLLSQLLSLYPQNANYNYGYGVCLVELNRDIPKALKYLQFASASSDNPRIIYYTGRCFHLMFRFDEAITKYNEFKGRGVKPDLLKYEVDRKIEMCNSGRELLRYISDLTVVDNKKIQSENFYYSYDLKEFGGKLILKPKELKSKTDIKLEPANTVVFKSNVNNKIYYASYDKLKNRDIYRVSLNKDGTFGIPENLGPAINTPWEEDFPVLHSDTVTLYFSSKGHNSMGGYDVFRSVLDSATNKFSRPENLDFPVNTPYDDYLYVADVDNHYAFFTSNRETNENKITVYKIIIDKDPIPRQFDNLEEVQQKSLLEVSTADVIRKAEESRTGNESKTENTPVILSHENKVLKLAPFEYTPAVTQTQIVEEAGKDVQALKEKNEEYKKQSNQLYAVADRKNTEAEQKRIESANLTNDLYKYSDAEVREQKKEEAYKLIEEAEKLEKESVLAFNLANNLEKNNADLSKEIKRTENFQSAVSTSGNTVTTEALVQSLNQNREKLNQAQNKYVTPEEEANQRLTEANVRKTELEYYKKENDKLENDITNLQTEIDNIEKELSSAPPERKEEISSRLFDKQEQMSDMKQKQAAITEPLQISESDYNNLITEAQIYNNLSEKLSDPNYMADAGNINKDELSKKIFDTELHLDVESANNNQVADNVNRNNNRNVTANNYQTTDNNQNVTANNNQTTNNNQNLTADNNTVVNNSQVTNNNNPANNQNTEKTNVQNDFSSTKLLPENKNKDYSPAHNSYQEELLNARFFDNMAKEQQKQLDILNQMNPDDPSVKKDINAKKTDLEKQIAANKEKSQQSKEKASKLSSNLSPEEASDTLSTVKYLSEGFEAGKNIEENLNEAQVTELDKIDEQKAYVLNTHNTVVQKQKMYYDLKVRKESSSDPVIISNSQKEIDKILVDVGNINNDYKPNLKITFNNEYNFYKMLTDSRRFFREPLTNTAASVEKEAGILHDKAIAMIDNADVIENSILRFKEYEKAEELHNLSISKQKYALELYVKASEDAKLIAQNPVVTNDTTWSRTIKTTLGADEEEQLKAYSKESGKADNIIQQADTKLNDIKERREKAEKTYSQNEKKNLLKNIDKEELQAKNEKATGLEKMSYADSLKYLAYRSQTQTMLNQPGGDKSNKAIAEQYLKEAEFFYKESSKIKKEAVNEKDPTRKVELLTKVTEMEKKALTSQELAVEVMSEPDPVLFVSSGNLTRVERLEAIDQPVATDQIVKIRTDRIVSKINHTENDLKSLDAATAKADVISKLNEDAERYKKEIDSLKTIVNNPDANPKDKNAALKKIAPIEKKYFQSIFSATEISEQVNDTRFYMYKDYIKPTRLNDNSEEDRQAKQLERNANAQYNKAKMLRDKSFATESPEKAYAYLVEANKLENQAIEDIERAFGLNLKLVPLEEEIKEYAEKRKQRVAPEYETYMVKTRTDVTPIETTPDSLLASNDNNRNVNNQNTNDTTKFVEFNTNVTYNNTENNNQNVTANNNNTENNNQTENNNRNATANNNTTENNNQTGNNNQNITANNNNNVQPEDTSANIANVIKDAFNNSGNPDQNNTRITNTDNYNNNKTNVSNPLGDTRIFSVLPTNAYSNSNPIPRNPALPDGLVFKVQIGAFRNPVSNTAFGGLTPINSETVTGSDLIRYLVGLFRTTEAAFVARDQARKMGFRDAFVVAYMNGKRISITEARKLAAGQPQDEYKSLVSNETSALNNNNTASYQAPANQVKNTTQSSETYSYPDVTQNKDLFYTVQIGVYKYPVPPSELKNLSPIYEEKTQGFIRYTTGIFATPEQANSEKNKIVQKGIADAFVSAYYKGQKISLGEAKRISQGGQQTTRQTTTTTNTQNPVANESPATYDKGSIVFKVQVGAYKEQVPVDMVNRFIAVARNHQLGQFVEGGSTIYMVGSFTNYDEAVKTKDAIVKEGLKDAFVIAFAGNKKIPVPEALKILNQ